MKKWLSLALLLATGAFGPQAVVVAHGGISHGPGDTVPPGGGGGGGSGGPGGSYGGPGTSGPSGPSAPGPAGPSTPSGPGPAAPGPSGPRRPSSGGSSAGPDLTLWQFWWGFNKDPYLNLKSHIHRAGVTTGSDDYFLGHGQETQAKDNMRPSEETIRAVIVPALIKALETERHNDIVTGAMIALAKIGDVPSESSVSPLEQLILPYLSNGSQEIAETAAVALGILGNPDSIGTLKSLLMDDAKGRKLVKSEAGVGYRTRAFAAYGLGQVGFRAEDAAVRQEIVDILWEVCESPRARTRDVKVAAVIAMGLVPLDLVAERAATDEKYTGGPRNLREQVEYLIEFFGSERDKNKHYLVRAHAPRAICKLMEGLNDPALKQHVVDTLAPYVTKRGNVGVQELRQSAALAFGMIGDLDDDDSDKTIRAHLIDSSANSNAQVKNFSVIAMGQVGGRPGTGENPMDSVGSVRNYLLMQLSRGKTQVKPWAGLAIGIMERGLVDNDQLQSADSLAALRSALRGTKTKLEVGAYAIACGIAGDTDSEKILLEKLGNMSDDDVRGHLAIGLGLMNSRSAIAPISTMVEQSTYRSELLQQAAIALGLLGDQNLVGKLLVMLANAKSLTTQAAVASALGFIGDARSVEPLVEMLHDQSSTGAARGFAAVALGIVADKECLPWNAKFSVDINYRANTTTLTGASGTGLLDIL